MNPSNPVAEFYNNYNFNTTLPVILCESFEDMIKRGTTNKESAIFVNTKPSVINSKVSMNFSYPSAVKVIFVCNVEFRTKGMLDISGNNFSVSNISFFDGDKSYTFPTHIVNVKADDLSIINFQMKNVQCSNSDLDFFRVENGVQNFQMYNSLLDGKSVNGVFLRLDFPYKYIIKNCVFRNFVIPNVTNGGEMIRMATSQFENKDSFAVVDSCYFTNCKGDPEVLSIKCSSVTVKNTVFSDNGGKRLTLRHTHRDTIDKCYFGKDGARIYGTNHKLSNIQLEDNASILLDNKSGSSYVTASNCTLDNIFYFKTSNPVENKGTNNKITNLKMELKYPKSSFFLNSSTGPVGPIEPIDTVEPVSPSGPVIPSNTTGPTGINGGDNILIPFKIYVKGKKAEQKNDMILSVKDQFNIEYVTKKRKTYNFILNGSSHREEKNFPYFMFGDNSGEIKYDNLPKGKYELVIKETGDKIQFSIQ